MQTINLSELLNIFPRDNQQVSQSVDPQNGGGASGGYTTVPQGDAAPKDQIQTLARQKSDALFGPGHFAALQDLINRESGWNPQAANKTSSARGLFQFLDSTAKSYGLPADATQATPEQQIDAGLKYIQARYGNPTNALDFWLNKSTQVLPGAGHWY